LAARRTGLSGLFVRFLLFLRSKRDSSHDGCAGDLACSGPLAADGPTMLPMVLRLARSLSGLPLLSWASSPRGRSAVGRRLRLGGRRGKRTWRGKSQLSRLVRFPRCRCRRRRRASRIENNGRCTSKVIAICAPTVAGSRKSWDGPYRAGLGAPQLVA